MSYDDQRTLPSARPASLGQSDRGQLAPSSARRRIELGVSTPTAVILLTRAGARLGCKAPREFAEDVPDRRVS
jgi:hypothetical protein